MGLRLPYGSGEGRMLVAVHAVAEKQSSGARDRQHPDDPGGPRLTHKGGGAPYSASTFVIRG